MTNKKTWLGIGFSALFFYLAFRHSDWAQVWAVARQTNLAWLGLALPVMFLAFWLKAVRWRYLMLPVGRPGLHSLFGSVMIGYMALNVLPLRLGEFVRAYVLGRREALSVSGVFATIVVERIFDGFTMLIMLLAPLFFPPIPLSPEVKLWINAFAWFGLAVFVGAGVFVVLLRLKNAWIIGLFTRILKRWPGLSATVVRLLNSFSLGLEAITNLKLFIYVSFYSILVWICYAVVYWLTMYAFQSPAGVNAGAQAGPLGATFVMVAVGLGIMVPASPGFVGVFEWACIMSMVAVGVDRSTSESYALVVHAFQYIPVTLVGIGYLYWQGLSLKDLRSGQPALVDPET